MGAASMILLAICGIAFAGGGILLSRVINKGSYNPQKGEAYECGVPTQGPAWGQMNVGYYLFALLFLVFDVELVFLYPWAVVVKKTGMVALAEIAVFLFILFLGFLYAHKKGALKWKTRTGHLSLALSEGEGTKTNQKMEPDKTTTDSKALPFGEGLGGVVFPGSVHQTPGGGILVSKMDDVLNWARSNSLWPLVFGTSCCAIEMMSTASAKYDWSRFGFEVARATPRQADVIIIAGTIVNKMAPVLKRLYDQMADPKYVIAMGACATSGGPFFYNTYSVVKGADHVIPVDVYIAGCPPRPEALIHALITLQDKIKAGGRREKITIEDIRK